MGWLIDHILHMDRFLNSWIQSVGSWTYVFLFLIIFCETGLVVTPFLPGDSIIFAAAALAASGSLNVWWLFILLAIAAIAGDSLNYWLGDLIGPKIFHNPNARILKKKYLDQSQHFYEKYGAETIVLARFVPIVRTFAPFVAGIGTMKYRKFFAYNVIGGIAWVGLFAFGGYFFGSQQFVKDNFGIVLIAIVVISICPAIIQIFLERRKKRAASASAIPEED